MIFLYDKIKKFSTYFIFEDNAKFMRKSPFAVVLIIKKIFQAFYNAFLFSFLNYSQSFPENNSKVEMPNADLPQKNMRLYLGDGAPMDGFVKVSRFQTPDSNIVRNIEQGLPFSENTVAELYIDNIFIYVKDIIFTLNELYRVCQPNALIKIRTLTNNSPSNYTDPTQLRVVNIQLFKALGNNDEAYLNYGFTGHFKMISLTVNEADEFTYIDLSVKKTGNQVSGSKKVDLGCGFNKIDGCLGLDQYPSKCVDIVRNIEKNGLPFSDNTVEYIHAHQFMEHLDNFIFVMNEIYRVCCHNAIVNISVPTLINPYALADPTHKRFFNVRSFTNYFEKREDDNDCYAGIIRGYEIISQTIGTVLKVKLRVIKNTCTKDYGFYADPHKMP